MELINGRAKKCQVYPAKFCDAVCEGMAIQMKNDERKGKEEERGKVMLAAITTVLNNVQDDHHEEDVDLERWQCVVRSGSPNHYRAASRLMTLPRRSYRYANPFEAFSYEH